MKKLDNKGFAISGIVYSLMLLFVIILYAILAILVNRKIMLDKSKNDLMKKLDNIYMYSVYENGTAVYFNPVTGEGCNQSNAVSLNGTKTGCMKWYTFNDTGDSDTVSMILDHNITENVVPNMSYTQHNMDTATWKSSLGARFIQKDEIVRIIGGFASEAPTTEAWSDDTISWLIASADDSYHDYYIALKESVGYYGYGFAAINNNPTTAGIRPVITVSKSVL